MWPSGTFRWDEQEVKGLNSAIVVLQAQMPDPKTYKQHYENKHPKSDLPDELKDVV